MMLDMYQSFSGNSLKYIMLNVENILRVTGVNVFVLTYSMLSRLFTPYSLSFRM